MNIYLIASESYKLLNEKVEKLTKDFSTIIKMDLRLNKISEIVNEANYFSFVDDKKCIIVKSAEIFKNVTKEEEKELEILDKYLDNPNTKCTIIFTSLVMPDKRKKLFKKIEKVGKVDIIQTLNKKDLCYKCIDSLKNKGYKCDWETASYIVDSSYVNYDIMTNELDKIYLLMRPQAINIELIKDIVSKSLNGNVFSFTSAILCKNLEKAHNVSSNFQTLKIDPIMVLIMLSKEFEILYLVMTKKSGEVQKLLHKEDWQMDIYNKASMYYTEKEIKKIIIKLNDYDYKLKSGILDKSIVLDLIALDLCE